MQPNTTGFLRYSPSDPVGGVKGLLFTFIENNIILCTRETLAWVTATVDALYPETKFIRELEERNRLVQAHNELVRQKQSEMAKQKNAAKTQEVCGGGDGSGAAGTVKKGENEGVKSAIAAALQSIGKRKEQDDGKDGLEKADEQNLFGSTTNNVEAKNDEREEEEEEDMGFALFAPVKRKAPEASVPPSNDTSTRDTKGKDGHVQSGVKETGRHEMKDGGDVNNEDDADDLIGLDEDEDEDEIDEDMEEGEEGEEGSESSTKRRKLDDGRAAAAESEPSDPNTQKEGSSGVKIKAFKMKERPLISRVMELDLGVRGCSFLEIRDPEVDVNKVWEKMVIEDLYTNHIVQSR